MAGEERVAGLSSRGKSFAQQSRRQRGGAFRRTGVERGGQEGAAKSLVERALATHRLADRCGLPLHEDAERSEILAKRRTRHAPLAIKQPPRNTALTEIEPPALAVPEVSEVEDRCARIVQSCARSDPIEIIERFVIA